MLDSGSAHLVLSQQASRRLLVALATPASSQTYPACETNVITDCSKEGGAPREYIIKKESGKAKRAPLAYPPSPYLIPERGTCSRSPFRYRSTE